MRELDAERKKLERALSNLTGGRVGPPRPRPAARLGERRHKPRRRRGRRDTRADQAVKLIKANPGITRLGGREEDADQAELPLPRARRPAEGRPGQEVRPQYTAT